MWNIEKANLLIRQMLGLVARALLLVLGAAVGLWALMTWVLNPLTLFLLSSPGLLLLLGGLWYLRKKMRRR